MADLMTLMEVIETGADIALIAIAYSLWKLDRRVLTLETIITTKV